MTIQKKIQICFWKFIRIVYDKEPKSHLPKYLDYPIASCDITDKYDVLPDNVIVLYEWDECGKHWIVFKRALNYF